MKRAIIVLVPVASTLLMNVVLLSTAPTPISGTADDTDVPDPGLPGEERDDG